MPSIGRRRYPSTPLRLFILLCISSVALLSQSAPPTLVRIHVPTNYDDSPASLRILEALASRIPPYRAPYSPPLSTFIYNTYRVSGVNPDARTFLPKTYSLLLAAILKLNAAARAEDLPAGKDILVPSVPQKALEDPNPLKPLNKVAGLVRFSAVMLSSSVDHPSQTREVQYEAPPEVSQAGRPATQTQALEMELPPDVAIQIMQDPVLNPTTPGTDQATADLVNLQIPVRLAGAPDPGTPAGPDHLVLNDVQRDFIQKQLTTQAQRDVKLFVLDTGWPDPDSYNQSRSDLADFLQVIWQQYLHLPLPPLPASKPFAPPANPHCTYIQRSLAELQRLDPNKHVKVIYLPLTREQDAREILVTLLHTQALYSLMKPSKWASAPVKKDIDSLRKQAEKLVDQSFPVEWTGDEVITDKSILDAILTLSQAYAKKVNSVYFINESWTVKHDQYYIAFPDPPQGAVLAATGNNSQNVNTELQDFAQRCTTTRDTIAVINARPGDGPICDSSVIEQQDIGEAMSVAFDGEVHGTGPKGLCGTSFAAPRVAWLLAADESTRTAVLQPQRWALTLQHRLVALRDPNASGFLTLWFDVTRFLNH
jgi:hypothetical protein